jgi:hypothetical protein
MIIEPERSGKTISDVCIAFSKYHTTAAMTAATPLRIPGNDVQKT